MIGYITKEFCTTCGATSKKINCIGATYSHRGWTSKRVQVELPSANVEELVEKFDRIMNANADVHAAKVAIAFRPTGTSPYRLNWMHDVLENAKRELHAAWNAINIDETWIFKAYHEDLQKRLSTSAN